MNMMRWVEEVMSAHARGGHKLHRDESTRRNTQIQRRSYSTHDCAGLTSQKRNDI